MWDKITVGKFQQLHDIIAGQAFEYELERKIHLLACLDDEPVGHYEEMPLNKVTDECQRVAFLSLADIPKVPTPRVLVVEGHRFRPVYDFRDLCAGQFVDVLSIAKTPDEYIVNLHKMLAAICLPVEKKGLFGRSHRVLKYGAVKFDEVADIMLQAPIVQAQAIALFFYRAWKRFLEVIPGCLDRKEQMGKQLTEMEASMRALALCANGDG